MIFEGFISCSLVATVSFHDKYYCIIDLIGRNQCSVENNHVLQNLNLLLRKRKC